MRATRLDPFSARLHAIHLKGAKANPPEPALQEESAPEGATTGMPGSMSYVPVEDEPHAYRSDSLRAFVARDDDEPPRPGHFAPNIPRDYHEPQSPRDATDDADLSGHVPVSGHRPVSGWGRGRDDEDARDQIRELRRRVEELEMLVETLNARVFAGAEDE